MHDEGLKLRKKVISSNLVHTNFQSGLFSITLISLDTG